MNHPRHGRGALPLLLKLSILRARQAGDGSLAERGYGLAVALIASFVLLLGVGALASRSQLGFIGQVFQAQNRQARDVAESAIAEFSDVMNREPNRHLLIAGTTANWNSATWTTPNQDFRNICTAFDNTNDTLIADGSGNPVYANPQAIANDFLPSSTDFIDRGDGRSFRVENIEFLTEGRDSYIDGSNNFIVKNPAGQNESYGVLFRSGAERALIRVTVVGRLEQNGRVSTARVAREFEVVPKCCNRSFGRNLIGGVNWGRDARLCLDPGAGPGTPGLIAGMGGGLASGSNNNKPIVQEDGTPVTEAACWAGNDPNETSVLTGTPNTTCTDGDSAIGNISFVPSTFSYNPEATYNNPAGAVTASAVPVNSNGVIYYDATIANNASFNSSGLVLRQGTGTPTRIDGSVLTSAAPDPCYEAQIAEIGNKIPYSTFNCITTGIDPGGNRQIFIDTSSAKINIFMSGNGGYGIGSGNAGVFRIHNFRDDLTGTAVNCTGTDCDVEWPDVAPGDPVLQADRLDTFLELCADVGYDCDPDGDGEEEFAVRNLLNFYADGTGTFIINGNSSGIAYNIYAPNATVRMNGGGNADNFMGQVWTNNLILNGNIKIFTFSGAGGVGTPGSLAGIPLIDFIARSFTQSSGF